MAKLPDTHVGLVVADTRRAMAWEDALRARGFEVMRVETSGAQADKGDWSIGVPRAQASRARQYVSDVVSGREVLPSRPVLPRTARLALVAIVVTAGVWFLLAAFGAL